MTPRPQSRTWNAPRLPGFFADVGYYDNRTNFAGATFAHTNVRLGPVRLHGRVNSIPEEHGRESGVEVEVSLPLCSLRWKWSWVRFRPGWLAALRRGATTP